MYQVSVLVPVYNAENYLKDCLDSVLCQTYSDFELILIDDGSTDNSSMICDQYAEIDSRISVCHSENRGVSSARNIGLDNARGSHVVFIDADDLIGSLADVFAEKEIRFVIVIDEWDAIFRERQDDKEGQTE